MITVTHKAKFCLMYGNKHVVAFDEHDRPVASSERTDEPSIVQTAIIEVDGLRLYSEPPKDAAHAERINKAIERLTEALPPIVP
jgi:hypothetical protein